MGGAAGHSETRSPARLKSSSRPRTKGRADSLAAASASPPRPIQSTSSSDASRIGAVNEPASIGAAGRTSAAIASAPMPFSTVKVGTSGQRSVGASASRRAGILTATRMRSGAGASSVRVNRWTGIVTRDPSGRTSTSGRSESGSKIRTNVTSWPTDPRSAPRNEPTAPAPTTSVRGLVSAAPAWTKGPLSSAVPAWGASP